MATGINKADVMRKAWSLYRDVRTEVERRALAKGFVRDRFRNCLRDAWAMLKAAVRPAEMKLAEIRAYAAHRVVALEMVDTLTHRGSSSLAALVEAREFLAQVSA